MKITTLLQTLLLLGVISLGIFMSVSTMYQYSKIHSLIGMAAGGVSFVTILIALKQKQPKDIRNLSIATLVFISLASVGGHLIQLTANFFITFGLMESAGIAALATSIVMLKKIL